MEGSTGYFSAAQLRHIISQLQAMHVPQDCPAMVDARKRLAEKETAEEPEPRPDIQHLRTILRDLEAVATVPVDQCPDCISMRKRIAEACKARDAKTKPTC